VSQNYLDHSSGDLRFLANNPFGGAVRRSPRFKGHIALHSHATVGRCATTGRKRKRASCQVRWLKALVTRLQGAGTIPSTPKSVPPDPREHSRCVVSGVTTHVCFRRSRLKSGTPNGPWGSTRYLTRASTEPTTEYGVSRSPTDIRISDACWFTSEGGRSEGCTRAARNNSETRRHRHRESSGSHQPVY
jgi:hypothetical protein